MQGVLVPYAVTTPLPFNNLHLGNAPMKTKPGIFFRTKIKGKTSKKISLFFKF